VYLCIKRIKQSLQRGAIGHTHTHARNLSLFITRHRFANERGFDEKNPASMNLQPSCCCLPAHVTLGEEKESFSLLCKRLLESERVRSLVVTRVSIEHQVLDSNFDGSKTNSSGFNNVKQ
jgi:hypothetical protein